VLAEALAATALIALALGALGPAIDAERTYASYGYTPDQAGEHRRFELDAAARCQAANENAGWNQLADGTIVCTDKRGRRQRAPAALHAVAP
jgi:hypothetical protein